MYLHCVIISRDPMRSFYPANTQIWILVILINVFFVLIDQCAQLSRTELVI